MKYRVMSRQGAMEYSCNENIPTSLMISINDVNQEDNRINKNENIVDVCILHFDDVESGKNVISEKDANKILMFLKKNMRAKNDIQQIIVHCGAGVSRSAGVCAAIMKIHEGNDDQIFDNPKYVPNMKCYRTVLEAYYNEE